MYAVSMLGLLIALVLYAGSRTVAHDRHKLEAWPDPPRPSSAD